MMFGVEKLRTLLASAPGIKVVSANVTDKSGKKLWDDFAILSKGGVTFAVTGVTDKAFYDFNLSRGLQKADEFAFLDSRQALQRVIPEMRKQADVTVVLLHSGSGDAKRMVEGLEGIDIVVVGHGPAYKFSPEKLGSVLLVQSGMRGQYLGRTEVTLAGKQVVGGGGECTPLGEAVPIDPEFNSLVTAFNKKYDALAAKAKPAKSEKSADKSL
jgi:2',3'-cyclic-nucleotide 2'-phosphodiesterase (5'-nucleotidase family)